MVAFKKSLKNPKVAGWLARGAVALLAAVDSVSVI
jgi:hypothetical protein